MTTAKKIEWQELIEYALTVEGSLGNTFNRFYDYSFMNQIILMLQGVKEPVATYRKWQEIGRQVKKGSKAKEIVRPLMRPMTDEEKDKLNIPRSEKASKIIGFKPMNCVFTLADTEGEDLPPVELPEWSLQNALDDLKIEQVSFEQLNGNVQGYSYERKYALNPTALNPAKTTMHELAHIVLGHTAKDQLHEYSSHRGLKEFQAEATAFLVMKELGQLTASEDSESRAYIQHWLEGDKPEEKAIRAVFTAVNKILKAGKVVA